MTTNQTIDGVPRELLEVFAGPRNYTPTQMRIAMHELRALLDAQHAVCSNGILCQNSKCQECGGNGAYKPAAQPQGVSVAWLDWSGGDCPVDADAMVEYAMAGNAQQVCRPEVACRLDWRHDHRPTKRKSNIVKYREIAEQPVPVAVVLPERLTPAELEELEVIEALIHGQGLSNLAGTMAAARQFIDEVTRLNPSL